MQENVMRSLIGLMRRSSLGCVCALPLFVALMVLATADVHRVAAQEADEDVVAEDDAAPAEPPADEAEVDPAADDTNAAAAAIAPPQSYLGWLYNALGLLYSVIFLVLSFALVAVF